MELHEALSQISEIRGQIARTETFRGYRSATVAGTAAVACLAAVVQAVWIESPAEQLAQYLTVWLGAAAVCVVATAVEMIVRCRKAVSPLAVSITWLAVEQFGPCLLAGAAVTGAIVMFVPQGVVLLPGLWSVLFSLGVFASCRLLPKQIFTVGVYYLLAGMVCLAWANGPGALSPWAMVGTFGVGQLAMAAILYWTLERNHAGE